MQSWYRGSQLYCASWHLRHASMLYHIRSPYFFYRETPNKGLTCKRGSVAVGSIVLASTSSTLPCSTTYARHLFHKETQNKEQANDLLSTCFREKLISEKHGVTRSKVFTKVSYVFQWNIDFFYTQQ